ncbi:RNA polymerase II transcriptional coactivator KELP [Apostasia shenzhenica]|uniref:RNA polymerase II transcriptional coactivator KELP n=1 Tax=Apostasia shenzhenica TaxID=1088818 RepID=A0A2H9ZR20_9ASPA|nr:RNA polymerase II transcriptional coactivator KELP [Apostasia shenzhenica]
MINSIFGDLQSMLITFNGYRSQGYRSRLSRISGRRNSFSSSADRGMDDETRRRIEEAVLGILRSADMDEMTEYKVRTLAAERLSLDLSRPDLKRFIRGVVESFLLSRKDDIAGVVAGGQQGEQQLLEEAATTAEEEVGEEEDDSDRREGEKEYDDEGNLIVCRLSNKRKVTVQDFRGKTLVSIREYFEKDGRQLPTSKGSYCCFDLCPDLKLLCLELLNCHDALEMDEDVGISLTVEQWEAFAKAAPAVDEAIKKLLSSD